MSSLLSRASNTHNHHGHTQHVFITMPSNTQAHNGHTDHVFITIQVIKYTILSWAYRACLHYYPSHQINIIIMGKQNNVFFTIQAIKCMIIMGTQNVFLNNQAIKYRIIMGIQSLSSQLFRASTTHDYHGILYYPCHQIYMVKMGRPNLSSLSSRPLNIQLSWAYRACVLY